MLEMQLFFFLFKGQTAVYFVPPGLECDGFLQRKIKQLHFYQPYKKKLLLLFVAFG